MIIIIIIIIIYTYPKYKLGVFVDIVGRVLTHDRIQPNFWYFTKYKSDPFKKLLDPSGLNISGWAKIFMDITDIQGWVY